MDNPLQETKTSRWGPILIGLWIALIFGSELLGISFGARLTRHRAGQNELWQRIYEHLTGDVIVLAVILIGALACVAFLWRNPSEARKILLVLSVMAAYNGLRVLVILWKTSQVMHPDLATTTWPNLHAYSHDPVILVGQGIIVLAGTAFVAYQIWRPARSSTSTVANPAR